VTTDARPPSQPPCSGPVSAALEADVRTWVRRHGIVVWLDAAGQFSDFVDRLPPRPSPPPEPLVNSPTT